MPGILILACPRSGTKYTATLLQSLGVDVSHECTDGADGMIGWRYAAAESRRCFCEHFRQTCRLAERYETVWHQVRHPLEWLRSIPTIGVWEWIRTILPGLPLGNGLPLYMRFWVAWNELCERQATWTYRVEDLRAGTDTMAEMLRAVGVQSRPAAVPTDTNTRRTVARFAERIIAPTLADLHDADAEAAEALVAMAARYGYRCE